MNIDKPYNRIERLAQDIFADRLILTMNKEVWADKPVEPAFSYNVRTNWKQLVSMIEQGSMWLCVSHELHKPFWKFVDGRWLCLACKRLHPEVAKEVC